MGSICSQLLSVKIPFSENEHITIQVQILLSEPIYDICFKYFSNVYIHTMIEERRIGMVIVKRQSVVEELKEERHSL